MFWVPGKEVARFQLMFPQGVVFRNRCETDPESRGGAGVGSENGWVDKNSDDGTVGIQQGVLADESETAGRAVNRRA